MYQADLLQKISPIDPFLQKQPMKTQYSCNSTLLIGAHVIATTINELLGNKQLFQLDWITICPN